MPSNFLVTSINKAERGKCFNNCDERLSVKSRYDVTLKTPLQKTDSVCQNSNAISIHSSYYAVIRFGTLWQIKWPRYISLSLLFSAF